MKKLLRLLSVVCCSLATHSYAEMLETSSGNDNDPVGFEIDLQGSYTGEGDIKRGSRRIENFDAANFLARLLILPRTPIGILRLGAEYEIYEFGIAEFQQVPDRLQSIAAVIGLDTKFSDEFLVRFEAKPGFYSADSIEGKDFNVPFILGGTYLYSSTLQFVFGIGVDLESQYPALPGGGVRWKFAPQWVLNAVLPQPRLEYEINRNLLLYVGGELRAKTFRVDDDFIGDITEPGNLNNAILAYREVRAGGGLVWKLGQSCKLSAEGGFVAYRQFDYHRADIRYKSDGGAPYGAVTFHCSF